MRAVRKRNGCEGAKQPDQETAVLPSFLQLVGHESTDRDTHPCGDRRGQTNDSTNFRLADVVSTKQIGNGKKIAAVPHKTCAREGAADQHDGAILEYRA